MMQYHDVRKNQILALCVFVIPQVSLFYRELAWRDCLHISQVSPFCQKNQVLLANTYQQSFVNSTCFLGSFLNQVLNANELCSVHVDILWKMILPKTRSTSHPCWICIPSRTFTWERAGHTVTGTGKHLDAKNKTRKINFKGNVAKRNMTTSTIDSSATRFSERQWLSWDALKRSSLRWIGLLGKTTLISLPWQLVDSVERGELRYDADKASTWLRESVDDIVPPQESGGREAICKMVTKFLLMVAMANKLVGIRLWEFLTKMGWQLIERGNLCIQWPTIHLRYESQQELNSKIFIVNISITVDGSLLSPTGCVNLIPLVQEIHEHNVTTNGYDKRCTTTSTFSSILTPLWTTTWMTQRTQISWPCSIEHIARGL